MHTKINIDNNPYLSLLGTDECYPINQYRDHLLANQHYRGLSPVKYRNQPLKDIEESIAKGIETSCLMVVANYDSFTAYSIRKQLDSKYREGYATATHKITSYGAVVEKGRDTISEEEQQERDRLKKVAKRNKEMDSIMVKSDLKAKHYASFLSRVDYKSMIDTLDGTKKDKTKAKRYVLPLVDDIYRAQFGNGFTQAYGKGPTTGPIDRALDAIEKVQKLNPKVFDTKGFKGALVDLLWMIYMTIETAGMDNAHHEESHIPTNEKGQCVIGTEHRLTVKYEYKKDNHAFPESCTQRIDGQAKEHSYFVPNKSYMRPAQKISEYSKADQKRLKNLSRLFVGYKHVPIEETYNFWAEYVAERMAYDAGDHYQF